MGTGDEGGGNRDEENLGASSGAAGVPVPADREASRGASSTAVDLNNRTASAGDAGSARVVGDVDLEVGTRDGGVAGAAAGSPEGTSESHPAVNTASPGGTRLQRSASENLGVLTVHQRWAVRAPGLSRFWSQGLEGEPARPQSPPRPMALHRVERQLSELEEERPVETTAAKLLEMGFAMEVIDQALARGAGTVEEALYFICEAPDMLNDELLATQHRILDELQGRAGARGEGEVRPAVAAAGQAAGKAAAGQAGPDAEARSARVASARARGEAVTECEICLEDVVQSEMEGAQCGHSFCSDCWTAYLNTAIRNGEVLRITCPQAECGREVAEDEIKAKVARSVFEKYQRFYREAHLRLNPNARFCPTAGCGEVVIGNRFSKRLRCPKCEHDFCFRCNEPWHAGRSCEDAQDALFLRHKAENHIRGCPRCSVPIFKTSGCNHMTCSRCGHQYCYICGGVFFGGVHFARWNIFGCAGRMFDSDPPLPAGRARLKRWTWHVALVIGVLAALAIGVSMLANPLVWFCACCMFCVQLTTGGRLCSED